MTLFLSRFSSPPPSFLSRLIHGEDGSEARKKLTKEDAAEKKDRDKERKDSLKTWTVISETKKQLSFVGFETLVGTSF